MSDSRKSIAVVVGLALAAGVGLMFWSLHSALGHMHAFA